MTFFPWDEINALENKAAEAKKRAETEGFDRVVADYIDEVTDLFEMDYMYGVQDTSQQLGISIDPDFNEVTAALDKKFDGKGYKDRIREYFQNGNSYDIARVVATDAHRIYNTAMYDAAKRGGATNKTWRTMLDPLVRDPHDFLEGITLPIDAEFITYTGEKALAPGQFGVPELDINCRCWLEYRK